MPTLPGNCRAILTATLCTALAACQTAPGPHSSAQSGLTRGGDSSFCQERPAVCALIGAVVIGGVIAIASNGSSGSGGGTVPIGGGGNVGNASDMRLKTDVRLVEQLENGINLYAYRYSGDARVFVGVDAAEIRNDARHAHAVIDLGDGLLGVDYRALGLEMINEAEMRAAGVSALARARAS